MAEKVIRTIHVGFIVPLNELLAENAILEHEIGYLDLRTNVYSAVHFYKDTNQDTMLAWFEKRKRTSRNGYLRAYYMNKRRDVIIEMDVDGKQFYLIASMHSSQSPIQMKQDIARGVFGERKTLTGRIEVPCFAYKYDNKLGFITAEALTIFQRDCQDRKEALKDSVQQDNVGTS